MSPTLSVSTLEVRKDNWADTRINTQVLSQELNENEVLFKVDRQALTANNISYASGGDMLDYWGFFPTDDGWGRIPAMGWGVVIASAHPLITVGERTWGFYPYSSHHKILAGNVSETSFSDLSAHRENHAPIYSQFDRSTGNPIYDVAREDQDSLLRGLFLTSWLVEDFIDVNNAFGSQSCLITSASSKTSIALAYCVKQRGKLRSVGITSAGNVAFCQSLDCYDAVVSYDQLAELNPTQPVVMVDMAGNAKVISELHHHFGEQMMYSCRIGATHYSKMGSPKDLPGAKPVFFFAPTHRETRSEALGMETFTKLMWSSFSGFREFCDRWMTVERSYGANAVTATYQSVLAGKVDPASGQIVSMWDD
jgi:hypothetical protein